MSKNINFFKLAGDSIKQALNNDAEFEIPPAIIEILDLWLDNMKVEMSPKVARHLEEFQGKLLDDTEAKVVLVFEKILNLDDDAFDSLPDDSFPVYGEPSNAIFHTTRSTAPAGDTTRALPTPPVPLKDAPKESTRGGFDKVGEAFKKFGDHVDDAFDKIGDQINDWNQEMEDKWMDIVRNWIDQFRLEDKAREITPSIKDKIKGMMHGVHTGLAEKFVEFVIGFVKMILHSNIKAKDIWHTSGTFALNFSNSIMDKINPNGINGGARSEEDRHWHGSKEDLEKMRQQQAKEKADQEAQPRSRGIDGGGLEERTRGLELGGDSGELSRGLFDGGKAASPAAQRPEKNNKLLDEGSFAVQGMFASKLAEHLPTLRTKSKELLHSELVTIEHKAWELIPDDIREPIQGLLDEILPDEESGKQVAKKTGGGGNFIEEMVEALKELFEIAKRRLRTAIQVLMNQGHEWFEDMAIKAVEGVLLKQMNVHQPNVKVPEIEGGKA
ncbi:hypothetical protein BJ742DRAFT_804417 [Cladochytrium replicatum]|nr:hypothetical protein BJ742DRAFT_804417 [Cladochytrium replicatum]